MTDVKTMVKAKINGKEVTVPENTKILAAARTVGINIPTLCWHPDIDANASCGICIVKVISMGGKYLRACATPIENNMEIITNDAEIQEVRKGVLELILSAHPNDCLNCIRNGDCELQTLAADFGMREMKYEKLKQNQPIDDSAKSIVLNPEKCIKCGRCLSVCQNMQNVHAITLLNRGFDTLFGPSANVNLSESPCIDCGQCATHCPVAAIYEHDETKKVWKALADKDTYTVVQMAPSVRVGVGEMLGFEVGENITGKIYSALRAMGFDAIFDTNFGADMTIMEEASEFIERFAHKKGDMPMFTSCCPAWVKYIEEYYPNFISHLSSAKSPHQMLSAMAKTYYAEKMKIEPKKIFTLSIMPCTAKKNEIRKNETMSSSGYQDTDVVITTREFGRMIKEFGLDMKNIEEGEADNILGEYSGAGTIFGATGGVMEAALRTAYNLVVGKNLEKLDLNDVRGLDGVKEAKVDVAGNEVRVAVVNGVGNVEGLIEKIIENKKSGKEPLYHFVEVMACPGGCVTGGGQPYGVNNFIRIKRAKGLYNEDIEKGKNNLRCSHENKHLQELYKNFLEEPLEGKSHKYLHTRYKSSSKYKK